MGQFCQRLVIEDRDVRFNDSVALVRECGKRNKAGKKQNKEESGC